VIKLDAKPRKSTYNSRALVSSKIRNTGVDLSNVTAGSGFSSKASLMLPSSPYNPTAVRPVRVQRWATLLSALIARP
jgi:hypothetical protein